MPSDCPRGMIVALCTGRAPSVRVATSACPLSWYAVSLRLSRENAAGDLSAPMRMRSLANSRSTIDTCTFPSLEALQAALLMSEASSAPENPGVPRAMVNRSTLSDMVTLREWRVRMSVRPFTSGFGTSMWRSKRPGRVSALSSTSGKFVAPITISPSALLNPSSSVRIWLRVWRDDCCSVMARLDPTASISSRNTMHGPTFLAALKRSRTRLAPTPTYISSNSDPEAYLKGTPASPAIARARSVFPVPGGP
mmetsp:Transcript_4861/g.11686  ORF Transcript_4861/g.11686 Transcript_4861/m.11686 type:complete len:252 (-) Transcript_4861:301-1056(-)